MLPTKESKAIVNFFMTKKNMSYLLKGNKITNFDEVRNNLFKSISNNNGMIFIYEPRVSDPNHPNNRVNFREGNMQICHNSEYPDEGDNIVAKVLRYIRDEENGEDSLEIEVIDSLYYSKLDQPVIKMNGYYELENGEFKIKEISRLTLANRNC